MRGMEIRDSGMGDGSYTIRGHAAVFEQPSVNLGYRTEFIEEVARGAFAGVLATDPHVVSVWDHDTRYVLGSTLNDTLDLKEDTQGLYFWNRVAPTSYAADLRILLERQDITQCSFCFCIGKESWFYEEEDGELVRVRATIEEVSELYDVTVCAMGAYSQTDVMMATRGRFEKALHEGRVQGLTLDEARSRGLIENPEPAPELPAGEGGVVAPETAGDDNARELWLAQARAATEAARARLQ